MATPSSRDVTHLSRREFATAGIATLTTVLLARNPSARADSGQPGIIDCHTHFYDTARPQGVPWPPSGDTVLFRPTLPSHLRKVTEGLGITGTVVIEASAWLEDNQWLLDLAKDDPFILGIIGRLHPGERNFADNLKLFVSDPLFRGIRVNHDLVAAKKADPQFVADLRHFAGTGLTLDINCQLPTLAEIALIASDIPDLRIVVDHMPPDASFTEDRRIFYLDILRKLAALPHVFVKISHVARRNAAGIITDAEFYRAEFDELWNRFGPDRLIYGSNWPVIERVAPYAVALKIVRDYFATKGAEASSKYFVENSRTAYGWKARPVSDVPK